MTGRETVCRVEPALVEHVMQLLADASLASEATTADPDGLIAIEIDVEDEERARSVIGLVLPQLLERGAGDDDSGTVHLSDRLIRSEDDTALPGGLIDARPTFGYADPLADPADDDDDDYVPPVPPPLPRPKDPISRAAWFGVIAGPILLVLVHVFNLPPFLSPVSLAMFIVGFGTLVARMEDRPDKDDDGAVV